MRLFKLHGKSNKIGMKHLGSIDSLLVTKCYVYTRLSFQSVLCTEEWNFQNNLHKSGYCTFNISIIDICAKSIHIRGIKKISTF